MKKFNNYINLGLFFNGIFLLGNGLNFLPEFIKGLCCGLGITLILIGMYSEKHDISKIRSLKRNVLKRLLLK